MASSGIFELVAIVGGTGAMRSTNVLCVVDVADATQAAQGSLVKITLAQLYRTETTAVTVSTPLPDVAQTWNAAGVTFTAVKVNVTSTASAAGSLLIDLQAAAASKFSVRKDGLITGAAGLAITGASTITGTLGGVTTLTCTTVTATNLGGTLSTAAQPNVTSLGTIVALTATTGVFSGAVQVTGGAAVSGAILKGSTLGMIVTGVAGSTYDLTLTTPAFATVLAIPTGTGNVTIPTGSLTVGGGIAVTGASTITGTLGGVTTLTATTLGGTLSTAAQANVTSVGTLTSLTTSGAITLTAAAGKIIPGATSISHRNNADNADNLIITDAGAITVRGAISGVTTLTATTLAGTLSTAAQGSVTSLGTLTSLTTSGTITITAAVSKIVPGATSISLRNNADSADNLIVTDAGTVNIRGVLNVLSLSGSSFAGGIGITGGLLNMSPGCPVDLAASTTTVAGLNMPHGSAPTSPVNGDMWTTTAGVFIRINGVTKTFTTT